MTFFYTNQQSARLMWIHDHAVGITRLEVYAGEASPYELQDPVERGLVTSGVIPADEIPLIIQDKTFVPDDIQLAAQDPTWDKATWGAGGSLWFPHVYMPNQNPGDNTGASPMGRWDYGPWFWPPYTGLVHGPDPQPLLRPSRRAVGAAAGTRHADPVASSRKRSWTRRWSTGPPTRTSRSSPSLPLPDPECVQ